ncbi:MAG TPA: tRNA (adenosine(37)-N6)-dimethylallyltransferase MiaA [Candidatus Nanopelagicaceae bacterium]|nr:tRNA (adenosine(37)-N6)-dimethylallyltransferase MiaA [Candidatus Nanopelagicaceae bacterium]
MSVPLLFIVGPTAAGKSAVALDLAEALKAEIINADSMQLYRGMDIGTAKLPLTERRGIPHHLIDTLDVREEASVADYQAAGRVMIDDLRVRGTPVVVVGGSGLYIKALLDPLNFPGTNPEIRDRLELEAAELGATTMHQRLARLDPAAAAAILPGNARRIVRALEVIEITGQPFTATLPREGESHYPDAIQIGLKTDRKVLVEKINRRVDQMWEIGLVEEVLELERVGLREGKTARNGLGYLQILQSIDGKVTPELAREETKAATRKYARRQMSWFRRDQRISWRSSEEVTVRSLGV